MTYTLFVGCNIPARVRQYELSARAVSEKLGIGVADNREFKCCGNPILNGNLDLSLKILQNKFTTAKKAGADLICTACTHCQMQYEMATTDNLPDKLTDRLVDNQNLTTLLFTQILGAALGVPESELSEKGRLSVDLF